MLLILSLLLLIIVRVVRSDLTKYLDISEEDLSAEVEQGSPFPLQKMPRCTGCYKFGTLSKPSPHFLEQTSLSLPGGGSNGTLSKDGIFFELQQRARAGAPCSDIQPIRMEERAKKREKATPCDPLTSDLYKIERRSEPSRPNSGARSGTARNEFCFGKQTGFLKVEAPPRRRLPLAAAQDVALRGRRVPKWLKP